MTSPFTEKVEIEPRWSQIREIQSQRHTCTKKLWAKSTEKKKNKKKEKEKKKKRPKRSLLLSVCVPAKMDDARNFLTKMKQFGKKPFEFTKIELTQYKCSIQMHVYKYICSKMYTTDRQKRIRQIYFAFRISISQYTWICLSHQWKFPLALLDILFQRFSTHYTSMIH